MSSIKITEKEKRNLRNKAKTELIRLESYISNQETMELIDAFRNKFNMCETVYKIILAEHQRKKYKKNFTACQLKIQMNQVPYALKFAGYSFDKELLDKLFGSSTDKGKMSVKKLRDKTTHGLDKAAIEEIMVRRTELFGYMDSFLSVIRDFDNLENAVIE